MLRNILTRCSYLLFAASLVQPAHAALRYQLTLLPLPPMSGSAHARAISENGLVAGEIGGGDPISIFWPDSTSPPLIVCDQFCETGGVNSDGVVVGIAGEGAAAFKWTAKDGLVLLPDFTFCCAKAMAVNDDGTIVGEGYFNGFSFPQACRWINNQIDHLLPLAGEMGGIALDINTHGHVVGRSGNHAVLWTADEVIDLGSPGQLTAALGINDANDVVGSYTTPIGEPFHIRPFLWRNGVLLTLPTFSGDGEARAISADGVIVGQAPHEVGAAVVWWNGEVISLASRVINLDEGATLTSAQDINSSGQIVGNGTFAGQTRAFIADPIPPADVNIDGSVNVDDLIAVILAWGPCPAGLCHADVIENSAVDVDDLIAVILAWGT